MIKLNNLKIFICMMQKRNMLVRVRYIGGHMHTKVEKKYKDTKKDYLNSKNLYKYN